MTLEMSLAEDCHREILRGLRVAERRQFLTGIVSEKFDDAWPHGRSWYCASLGPIRNRRRVHAERNRYSLPRQAEIEPTFLKVSPSVLRSRG